MKAKRFSRQMIIQGLLIALSKITLIGFAIATGVVVWKVAGWWCLLWLIPSLVVKIQKAHLEYVGRKTIRGDYAE